MSVDENKEGLQNCGKCGLCLAICPVFRILKEEQASPRAKLQLIKAHEKDTLKSSELLKKLISNCLMCGSCQANCPSGVKHYDKFMEMRRKMVEELGETPAIKTLIYLLGKEYRLKMGAAIGKIGQKLTPDFIAERYKLGNIAIKRFPQLNPKPLKKILPVNNKAFCDKKGTVVYFTGCATNYMFEDTGKATVNILNKLGFEVIIPKEQNCCGLPAMFHGAKDKSEENIKNNIEAIASQDYDKVIVDCTTCGAALKEEYPKYIKSLMDKNSPKSLEHLYKKTCEISEKTIDIISFIEENNPVFMEKMEEKTAAYHAPCHSRNSFNTLSKVRNLLQKLPSVKYVPTMGESECCGGGGTFFFEQPEVAGKMIKKKTDEIQNLKPELWLTDCPVCRINLTGNLPDESVKVTHPVTIIDEALKKDEN